MNDFKSRTLCAVICLAAALGCLAQSACAPEETRAPDYTAQVINPDFHGGMLLPGGKTFLVWGSDGTILRSDDGAEWAQSATPSTVDLAQVASNEDGSVLVAVGAQGTILRSDDAGRAWHSSASEFADTDFRAVIRHAPSDTWIVAGTRGRILRSKDAGKTWTAVPTNLDVEFLALFVDQKANAVLIGGADGMLGTSIDAGVSWQLTKIAMPDPVSAVAGFKRHGALLVGISSLGRFLLSKDDAGSWELLQTSSRMILTDSAADPRHGTIVITGNEGDVLRSTDGGKNWNSVEVRTDGPGQYLSAVRFDAQRAALLAIGQRGTVARSTDGGATWSKASADLDSELRGIVQDEARGKFVTFGAGGLIAFSNDGGTRWTQARKALEFSMRDVAAAPRGGALVATGKLGAVIRSTDGGASWSPTTIVYPNQSTPPDLRMLIPSPSEDSLVAVGPPGTIMISDPEAKAWRITQWTPIAAERAFTWVVGDRQRKRLTTIEARGQMRVSHDGVEWRATEASTQGTDWAFWHAALLERDGVMISAGKSGTAVRSADGGLTWEPMKTGTDKDLFGSFADDTKGLLFLMGKDGALLRSADGARTWQAVRSGSERELRRMLRDPKTGALICFGAWGSIVRSEDDGLTWQAIPSGVEGELRKGVVDARSGSIYLAGSRGVALRSGDGGRSWKRLPSHTTRHFSSLIVHDSGDVILVGDRIVRLVRAPRR